jgi:hypothetical protein
MPSSEQDRRRRAEVAAELGFYPASLAPEDIDRHRRLNAALDRAPSLERVERKFTHLREEKRRAEVEERGRREVADLYEDGLPRWVPTKSVLPEPSVG